jgi:glycosyltransferase involved in cell wall biosynthesis
MKAALRLARQARRRQWLGLGRDELEKGLNGPGSPIYLLVSHRLAHWPRPIVALKKRGARFVALVHDLIPTNYPEYAPTNGALDHVARVNTFATLADGIIVNSAATAAELAPHLQNGIINIPLLAASLGIDAPRTDTNFPRPAGPYFVCLGTIEPRKNHLLLLHIWRDLAQRMGMETPKLLIIGRRGWKNENIIDMLERCPALAGVVREYADLPDDAVAGLLQGARALLFPSFAEGYGLPLAEALALGVPAICSDLPALREVGGDAPDYLSPLDGLAGAISSLVLPRKIAAYAKSNCSAWRNGRAQAGPNILRLSIRGSANLPACPIRWRRAKMPRFRMTWQTRCLRPWFPQKRGAFRLCEAVNGQGAILRRPSPLSVRRPGCPARLTCPASRHCCARAWMPLPKYRKIASRKRAGIIRGLAKQGAVTASPPARLAMLKVLTPKP